MGEDALVARGEEADQPDVGGVGFALTIPLGTYEQLPAEGAEAFLLTTFVVREDAHRLYGFGSEGERAFFNVLRGVSGVGPQVALAIVSSMTLTEFRAAVTRHQLRILDSGAKDAG